MNDANWLAFSVWNFVCHSFWIPQYDVHIQCVENWPELLIDTVFIIIVSAHWIIFNVSMGQVNAVLRHFCVCLCVSPSTFEFMLLIHALILIFPFLLCFALKVEPWRLATRHSQLIGFWIVYDFSWLNSIHANDYDSIPFNSLEYRSRCLSTLKLYVLFLFHVIFPSFLVLFVPSNRKYAIWYYRFRFRFVLNVERKTNENVLISNDVFHWTTSCDSKPFESFEWYLFFSYETHTFNFRMFVFLAFRVLSVLE